MQSLKVHYHFLFVEFVYFRTQPNNQQVIALLLLIPNKSKTENKIYLQVKPIRPKIIGIKSDKDGLDPAHLREALSQWQPSDVKNDTNNIPRLLYLIPNGGNPTGAGLTLERKKEIYEIARLYDLLILEDDPYFYLQFNDVSCLLIYCVE